tara:strand:- start:27046 stop:27201 length:156 start_codon:yes stop_codon:yes gene_type:complete
LPEESGIRVMFAQHLTTSILGCFQVLEDAIKHISHVVTACKKKTGLNEEAG